MQLRRVDPKEIRWPEVRMTSYMDQEEQQLFLASLKAHGMEQPIEVLELDGQLIGVDGYNRCMGAITLGWPEVDVLVRGGVEKDLILGNLATAFMRGKPRPTEVVKLIKSLTQDYHMGSDDITAATGMTRDYVERLWTIAEADPEILQALDDGLLGVSQAYIIARIPTHDVQLRVLDQQKMYHWKTSQLQEHVKAVLKALDQPAPGPSQATPSPAPQRVTVRCQFCGEDEDPVNVAHPPICVTCAGALHQAIRAERRVGGGG
jgi:ParB-like chromosome segregation protein Spo0J